MRHGTGGEAQHHRQNGNQKPGKQQCQYGGHRLNSSGEHAPEKGLWGGGSLGFQGQGDDAALRYVLQRDSQSQGKNGCIGD